MCYILAYIQPLPNRHILACWPLGTIYLGKTDTEYRQPRLENCQYPCFVCALLHLHRRYSRYLNGGSPLERPVMIPLAYKSDLRMIFPNTRALRCSARHAKKSEALRLLGHTRWLSLIWNQPFKKVVNINWSLFSDE